MYFKFEPELISLKALNEYYKFWEAGGGEKGKNLLNNTFKFETGLKFKEESELFLAISRCVKYGFSPILELCERTARTSTFAHLVIQPKRKHS